MISLAVLLTLLSLEIIDTSNQLWQIFWNTASICHYFEITVVIRPKSKACYLMLLKKCIDYNITNLFCYIFAFIFWFFLLSHVFYFMHLITLFWGGFARLPEGVMVQKWWKTFLLEAKTCYRGRKGRRRMTVRGGSKITVEHKNLKECRYVLKKREITFTAVAGFSACVEP